MIRSIGMVCGRCEEYGIRGKLLKAVSVVLRHGCAMSQWLFNVYMDGVVREVNARVLRKGLKQPSVNGDRFEIHQLLFTDDTALVADSEEKFCRLVSEFGRVCERRE